MYVLWWWEENALAVFGWVIVSVHFVGLYTKTLVMLLMVSYVSSSSSSSSSDKLSH